MGIKLFSSDSYPVEDIVPFIQPGNPDPSKFKIIDTLTVGTMMVVEVQYSGCTNYEGRKILVYDGMTKIELHEQKYIDPHFSDNKKYKSPVARFEPTQKGWKMAESFAKMWAMKK